MIRSVDVAREVLAAKGVTVAPATAREMVRVLLARGLVAADSTAEVRGRDRFGQPMTVVIGSIELRDAVRRSRPTD